MLPCNRADRGCVVFLGQQHHLAGNGADFSVVLKLENARRYIPASPGCKCSKFAPGRKQWCFLDCWHRQAETMKVWRHLQEAGSKLRHFNLVCVRGMQERNELED